MVQGRRGVVMRELFLDNCDVVIAAVGDPRVGGSWQQPSVLEGQTIGSLASHLARGSVWVVDDYLDIDLPAENAPLDYTSAGHYYATLLDSFSEDDHAAVRARGAVVAEMGHAGIVAALHSRIDAIRRKVRCEPTDRRLVVFGGKTMRLDDYLLTRLVEQVVHLDDLARSLDIEPYEISPGATDAVLGVGLEIGVRRHGSTAMVRALFRSFDTTEVLPVL